MEKYSTDVSRPGIEPSAAALEHRADAPLPRSPSTAQLVSTASGSPHRVALTDTDGQLVRRRHIVEFLERLRGFWQRSAGSWRAELWRWWSFSVAPRNPVGTRVHVHVPQSHFPSTNSLKKKITKNK